MTGAPIDLGEGVWQFQTPLWQTNAVLVETASAVVLCDPGWTPEEISAIGARAGAGDRAIHLLITHSDYDHTCGIGSFPQALVTTGPETAEAIVSGRAAGGLAAAADEWGLSWPLETRVDRVVHAGTTFDCNGTAVLAIDARGHIDDGLAFLVPAAGVLLAGDYLSPMTYPFVISSVADAVATCWRLLDAIETHRPRWVVPGHGRALSAAEAHEIGTADVTYLELLAASAADARSRGLSPGDALVAVYGVEPPRGTTDDFEVYGIRAANARVALAEAAS